jgi:hypothetical protein
MRGRIEDTDTQARRRREGEIIIYYTRDIYYTKYHHGEEEAFHRQEDRHGLSRRATFPTILLLVDTDTLTVKSEKNSASADDYGL